MVSSMTMEATSARTTTWSFEAPSSKTRTSTNGVDIARWMGQESDRSCPDKQEMERDTARWKSFAGSDHSLNPIKLKLKLRKAKKVEQRYPLLDIQKLKHPVIKRAFQLEVRKIFEVVQDQQQLDLDDFNTVMMEVGHETTLRLRWRKKWISTKTWDVIGKRKATNCKLLSAKSPRLKENLKRTYSQ